MAGGISALLLKAEDKNRWSVILHHADGRETTLPSATPAEHLITASEIDYSATAGRSGTYGNIIRCWRSVLKFPRQTLRILLPRHFCCRV